MKLRHFAVFGGIFTVIICLLLFLFIVTSDDEESGSSSLDFSGLNLSAEVLKHQSTVEKYAKEYRIYAGNNRMYHAGDPIGYADLTSSYWQQHLIGAGRVKTN